MAEQVGSGGMEAVLATAAAMFDDFWPRIPNRQDTEASLRARRSQARRRRVSCARRLRSSHEIASIRNSTW